MNFQIVILRTAITFMLLGAVACSDDAGSDVAMSPEARNVFNTRCVPCHGKSGKGDGAAAAALNPKPANWTNAAWQKSSTDASIAKVIVEGGPSVGKSVLMPPNPDLKDKKAVVDDLLKLVRSYGD